MAFSPSSMAPIKLNSTVLPNLGDNISYNVTSNLFQHSGNLFASLHSILGASPVVTFTTTLDAAYGLIGWGVLKLTVLDIYLSTYADFAKSSGSDHQKIALASSALGCAYINSVPSVGRDGIATAEVTVILLSSDGMTFPLADPTTASLPTLASEPTLHTLGPAEIGGTQTAGVVSISAANNCEVIPQRHDGDLYPTDAMYVGGRPMLSIGFEDHVAADAALAYLGSQATDHAVHFRKIVSNLTTDTTFSITTTGRAILDGRQDAQGAVSGSTITISGLSTSSTHPWTTSTSGTVA